MSQTYLTTLVMILATVLPKLGIMVGSEELTTTIQTIVVIVGGLWVMWRRFQTGDINIFGQRR